MKASLSWLRDFVDAGEGADELARAFTFSGTEVEGIERLDGGDALFTFEVTPNRPDCLSVRGLARELSALYDRPLREPETTLDECDYDVRSSVAVAIEDDRVCPRYIARVIRGVRATAPTPLWMRKRLELVGMRSINVVVDVTNYVMIELGHPLHAFDLTKIETREIVVRTARAGERFVALDEAEYKLAGGEVLICDGERPVALGGVMGGLDSGVSERTLDVLVESAYFDPPTTRRTSKRLGLSTESSRRFERGADPIGAEFASRRAAHLIHKLAGGKLERGSVDAFPRPIKPKVIAYHPKRAGELLGVPIDEAFQRRVLGRLGFDVNGDDTWLVAVPTYRPDVSRDVDLIEEVARVWNYDNLPADRAVRGPAPVVLSRVERALRRVRQALVGQGYFECVGGVYVSREEASLWCDHEPLSVSRPLSEDLSVLRPSLMPTLLASAAYNANRGARSLRLFEVGHGYHPKDEGHAAPWESHHVALLVTGPRFDNWSLPSEDADAHDLLGALDSLAVILGVEFSYRRDEGVRNADRSFCVSVLVDGERAGEAFRLSSEVSRKYDLDCPVYVAHLDRDALERSARFIRRAADPPRYPAAKRDLAFILDDSTAAGELVRVVKQAAGEICASVVPFDLYRGGQVGEGRYSLALALRFVHPDRTLEDAEVDEAVKRAVDAAAVEFGATWRSQ